MPREDWLTRHMCDRDERAEAYVLAYEADHPGYTPIAHRIAGR